MSEETASYFVLAFYLFTEVPDPQQLVLDHKKFFKGRDITSRIYISGQGINGQMSGVQEDAEAYMEWMRQNPIFKDVVFKIHHHHENVFPRQTVKYRKQLVGLDEELDLTKQGEHVSPSNWKSMMEKQESRVLLDVRNDYEWQVGRFEGAECPPCQTFREFKGYASELKSRVDPKTTPVMMYCTGGIRCELYSALLKKEGFEEVYQLNGGVIGYGLEQGSDHWLGKLFVFDDRLAVPISDEEAPVIGTCHVCGKPSEKYYNCANMDCNELFLCCPDCFDAHAGCCSSDCQVSPRVRPHQPQDAHKPFRKSHHYFNNQKNPA